MCDLRYLGSQTSDGLLPVCCAVARSASSTRVGLAISWLFARCFSLPITTWTKAQRCKIIRNGWSLWCNPENVRSEVCEGTPKLLQSTVASVSNNTFEGSKFFLDFTTHTTYPLKPELKWQHIVQILINYAVMHFFQNTILVCYYCTAFPDQALLIMVLAAIWEKAIKRW